MSANDQLKIIAASLAELATNRDALATYINTLVPMWTTQNQAIKAAQDAMSALGQLINPPAPPTDHVLPIPWVGQNVNTVTTDDYSNSDCGPACVAMILRAQGQQVTVDDVSRATGLPIGYKYTIPQNLIDAGAHFGLHFSRYTGFTQAYLQNQIDNGKAVIALAHYGSLQKRSDQNFKAGHWIVVVGYNANEVIYNDPYWQDETGKQIHLSWAFFLKAMADCAIDGNTPNQGLVMA